MKEKIYTLRAHHGMCLYYFAGKGYSDEFVTNMANAKAELYKNPLVRITKQADIICKFCPNCRNGICISENKVNYFDQRVLDECNLSEGTVLPFLKFHKLVINKILHCNKRKDICSTCEWNEICN